MRNEEWRLKPCGFPESKQIRKDLFHNSQFQIQKTSSQIGTKFFRGTTQIGICENMPPCVRCIGRARRGLMLQRGSARCSGRMPHSPGLRTCTSLRLASRRASVGGSHLGSFFNCFHYTRFPGFVNGFAPLSIAILRS